MLVRYLFIIPCLPNEAFFCQFFTIISALLGGWQIMVFAYLLWTMCSWMSLRQNMETDLMYWPKKNLQRFNHRNAYFLLDPSFFFLSLFCKYVFATCLKNSWFSNCIDLFSGKVLQNFVDSLLTVQLPICPSAEASVCG